MSKPIMIGTWGGEGGQPCQPAPIPSQLVRVVVASGDAINSIKFTYKDNSGKTFVTNLWGGSGGVQELVELGETEYVKDISGTYGPWGRDVPRVITSLKFVTNTGELHEFGKDGTGGSFHVPLREGKITGFFGRAGDLIDAIGVYVLP